MTLFNNIITIIGVVIGAIWVGIGVKWGQEIYDIFISEKFKKLIEKYKRKKENIKNELYDNKLN